MYCKASFLNWYQSEVYNISSYTVLNCLAPPIKELILYVIFMVPKTVHFEALQYEESVLKNYLRLLDSDGKNVPSERISTQCLISKVNWLCVQLSNTACSRLVFRANMP